MAFWERIKKDLQVVVKEGADLIKEGTATLTKGASKMAKKGAVTMSEEARRVTELGKLRYQDYRLKQMAQKKFTEIGGKVYDLASKDLKGFKMDEKLEKLILEMEKIEKQVTELELEILKRSKGKRKVAE